MSFFTALVTSKVAAGALAAGTLAVGGTTAAAYAGSLPEALQQSAHDVIGAPAPAASAAKKAAAEAVEKAEQAKADAQDKANEAKDSVEGAVNDVTKALPTGPDLTGPAAVGLCNAAAKGGLGADSTSYKSLVVAAKGAANITVFCQNVGVPGVSADKAAGNVSVNADVNVDAAVKGNVPAAPKLPSDVQVPEQPKVPAVSELPSKAKDSASELPTTAPRQ
ncbi:protein tyrosine phosphatase [Arthrobacter sp. M4]|uniref:protein tyrosine phosphatase n=1 Tax=Arthrobacter sp. M4 TaxID=218160 RepID=UPI001CDCFCC4|nr:protein tyrosine phosphatase [Arthrobacter sp. M4]MCA4135027.1 protein tyrosine phosphatase [Arthrobacter sp. M4]